jgi:hypothetical protein
VDASKLQVARKSSLEEHPYARRSLEIFESISEVGEVSAGSNIGEGTKESWGPVTAQTLSQAMFFNAPFPPYDPTDKSG